MKLSISLLFHFFLSSLIIFKTGEGSTSYGFLINKVYDEYETSGIIMTTNHLSFEKMTTLQIITREMSTRGIGSVVVKFKQLKETIEFHHKQSARPLVVIFIDKVTEIQEFKGGIVNMDMDYPVWLVLFTGDKHENSCGYCRHPIGNPFNTEVLVLCCNSKSIVKWSFKKTNQRRQIKISGIGSNANKTLNSSEQFMVNKGLRIVIWQESDYVSISGSQLQGYLGEMTIELSRVMNFSISQLWEEPLGVYQPEKSTWTGAIGAVAQGIADMGVAEFVVTPQRIDKLDFSLPVIRPTYTLYIAQSEHFSIQWNGFFKVLNLKVWITVIILLLITPLLLTIIEYRKKKNLFDIICMHYLNVWGLFCQQEWSSPLQGSPSRMIYLSLFISALVVNAGHSAALIRHLTTAPPYVPFHTLQEFVNDETYKVIVIRGSAVHQWIQTNNDTLIQKMKMLMKPNNSLPATRAEGFDQLCTEKVAFLHFNTKENLIVRHIPCETITLDAGGRLNAGMIFPLKSEYTEIVNHHIRKFRENGMLNRLRRKYCEKSDLPNISYDSVTFTEIIPILTIFAVGCSVAYIILMHEKR